MKRLISFIFSLFLFFSITGQDMAEVQVGSYYKTDKNPKSISQYFKINVEDWNVGNLHIFPKAEITGSENYYFEGQVFEKKYYRLLPWQLQNNVIKGSQFYAVSAIRGRDINDDLYILREENPKGEETIYLASIKENRFKVLKKLATYTKKGKKIQRTDSWIKDLDGDTRLDIVQKIIVMDESETILKEKYKVFRMDASGKFKKTKKIKINQGNYQIEK